MQQATIKTSFQIREPGCRDEAQLMRRLVIAAATDETEIVSSIIGLSGLHPDVTFPGKPTALCYAALHGNIGLVTFLLSYGANVHYADSLGLTPLHYSIRSNVYGCVEILLSHGSSVATRNVFGRNALELAKIHRASLSIYKLLQDRRMQRLES